MKRPIFAFLSSEIRPAETITSFALADDYSFGVLQSHVHWLWFITKCGKLKSDFRYSAESVFDTFPWPQFGFGVPALAGQVSDKSKRPRLASAPSPEGGTPNEDALAKITAVATAARQVRRVRTEALAEMKGGLRALYRTLELPGANPLKKAHAVLDAAVLAAYGFSAKKDLLAQLLALNLEVAAHIERGEPATAPGVPTNYPYPAKLVTADCIQPPTTG
jgi:hypothetical protein